MDAEVFMRSFLIRPFIYLFFTALSGFSISAHAQQAQEVFLCSYYGETISPTITLSEGDADAQQVIGKILSVVGLKPNFEVRAANVPNAAAVILKNKRYILYNPDFISKINYASGTNWAGISIMAHEIGHHLNGHTLQSGGSRPDLELEADEFSGFVLHKLGAGKGEAQAAMNVAASQKSSHTHPAKQDRLVAIADGWNNAGGNAVAQKAAAPQTISKPAMVKIPAREQVALDERYIAFDVYFDDDQKGQYFITTRGNLVTVANESIYIVGRLSESNRRDYKLMLSDKHYNYLYIAPKGEIVNGYGKSVGYIDTH